MTKTNDDSGTMPPQGRGAPPGPKRSRLKLNLKLKDYKGQKPTKHQIFELTSTKLNGFLTGLTETTNGFIAYTDQNSTIDSLTSNKGQTELGKINLETITPPEIRAKRTVFIRGLDYTVGQRDERDIADELTTRQNWLTNITVTKIKNYTHVIKLTCSDTNQTERLLRDGLTMFHTRIPPSNIEQEKFTPILICFKCYQFEKHTTNNCPSKTTVCSECGETGHRHFDCTSTNKTCLNCPTNNNHRTLAPSCPYRKRIIKDKEQQLKDKQTTDETQTYAKIVKTAIQQTAQPPRPTINLTDKTHMKIVLLVIEAHVAAITGDRPYNEIITDSFKRNYDIDVNLPDRDSQKILDIYLKTDQETTTNVTMESDSDSDSDEEPPNPTNTPAPSPIKNKQTRPPTAVIPKRKLTPEDPHVTKQRKTSQTTKPDIPVPYKLKVIRSDKDEEKLPPTFDRDWFGRQLNRKRHGLKIHVYGDVKTFKQHYRSALLIIRMEDIQTVDDETFQRYDRVTHFEDRQ